MSKFEFFIGFLFLMWFIIWNLELLYKKIHNDNAYDDYDDVKMVVIVLEWIGAIITIITFSLFLIICG